MASTYYGLNRGQNEFDVVEDTSTQSTDIELRVDQTKHVTKAELLLALEKIANRIVKDNDLTP